VPPIAIASPTSATAVTLNSQNDASGAASIATTEVDYIRFTAAVSGTYAISTKTPNSSLDTVLGVFSASGQLLAYNDDTPGSNDSRLSINLSAGATYYVGITNYSTSSRGTYTWTVDGPAPPDDAYENNDTRATAFNLGTLTSARAVALAMADSQDWFQFTTTGTGTASNNVSIVFQNSQGNLGLELYNAAGTLLARSNGVGNGEAVSLNGRAAGTYYARVYGALNPSYSLYLKPATTTAPPTIDLAGAGLTTTNATAWGQTITVQATVRNGGNSASPAFVNQWYLSRDTVGSAGDILLSQAVSGSTLVSMSGIAAGSTGSTYTVTLQLPSALPAGWSGNTFHIVMATDAATQIGETNEGNNFGQVGVGLDSAAITIGGATAQPGGFEIQVNMSGLTVTQRSIFQAAADRWEQVIVGDLPNATYGGQVVDDLRIDASATAIDGLYGILGQAGPDAIRSGSRLPYHGIMEFDSADLASMEQSGLLMSVVLHEMGHVLGIGTVWSSLGLLSGAGSSNPLFTGAQATAAYNQIFGTNASGVPVENGGGPGTADGHWRDSIFRAELMTGWAGPGSNLPLSLVTVASLADMGYQVNRSAADAFTPSASIVSLVQSSTGTSSLGSLTAAAETPSGAARGLAAAGVWAPAIDLGPRGLASDASSDASATTGRRTSLSARTIDALMAQIAATTDREERGLHHSLQTTSDSDADCTLDLLEDLDLLAAAA